MSYPWRTIEGMDQDTGIDLLQVITDLTALLNDVERARLARALRTSTPGTRTYSDPFTVLSLAANDLDDLAAQLTPAPWGDALDPEHR